MQSLILVLLVLVSLASAFHVANLHKFAVRSSTELYEDFNLKKTTIISDKQIFSEKQLREFTATYSVDERWNPFEALTNLLNKPKDSPVASSGSSLKTSLKSSVSLSVLEEKTAAYVGGKIDAKTFMGVLNAAFGPKLDSVFMEIVENLPAAKGAALKSMKK